MKYALAAFCYTLAFLCLYAGFSIAPEMKWPHTAMEYDAASLLIVGLFAKLIGHVGLLHNHRG